VTSRSAPALTCGAALLETTVTVAVSLLVNSESEAVRRSS
jgi:hypothetical protein